MRNATHLSTQACGPRNNQKKGGHVGALNWVATETKMRRMFVGAAQKVNVGAPSHGNQCVKTSNMRHGTGEERARAQTHATPKTWRTSESIRLLPPPSPEDAVVVSVMSLKDALERMSTGKMCPGAEAATSLQHVGRTRGQWCEGPQLDVRMHCLRYRSLFSFTANSG